MIKKMTDSLKKVSSVQNIEINQRTGSMVVFHDHDAQILDSINTALTEVAGNLLEAVLEAEELEFPGLSIIAHLIRSFLGKADVKLAGITNNLIDLKMLLPIAFFAAGVFQASRTRNWLGAVPAWVLFFYAYDAYMRFHEPILIRDADDKPATSVEGVSSAQAKPTIITKQRPAT